MEESSKVLKSSTAFFTQLQEEVQSHIKGKVKQKKINNKKLDIKKLKL